MEYFQYGYMMLSCIVICALGCHLLHLQDEHELPDTSSLIAGMVMIVIGFTIFGIFTAFFITGYSLISS